MISSRIVLYSEADFFYIAAQGSITQFLLAELYFDFQIIVLRLIIW